MNMVKLTFESNDKSMYRKIILNSDDISASIFKYLYNIGINISITYVITLLLITNKLKYKTHAVDTKYLMLDTNTYIISPYNK